MDGRNSIISCISETPLPVQYTVWIPFSDASSISFIVSGKIVLSEVKNVPSISIATKEYLLIFEYYLGFKLKFSISLFFEAIFSREAAASRATIIISSKDNCLSSALRYCFLINPRL